MIAKGRSQMATVLVISALLISGVFGALIWAVVYRPVRRLRQGIQHVARGDRSYRIAEPSRDEIGELASSFNHMTDELARAEEINQWTTRSSRGRGRPPSCRRAPAHGESRAHGFHGPTGGDRRPRDPTRLPSWLIRDRWPKSARTRQGAGRAQPDRDPEELDLIGSRRPAAENVKGLLQFARQARDYQANDINRPVTESVRLIKHKVD
jgi:HAMP domain-containing protein